VETASRVAIVSAHATTTSARMLSTTTTRFITLLSDTPVVLLLWNWNRWEESRQTAYQTPAFADPVGSTFWPEHYCAGCLRLSIVEIPE
jgi:hypothetical protein